MYAPIAARLGAIAIASVVPNGQIEASY